MSNRLFSVLVVLVLAVIVVFPGAALADTSSPASPAAPDAPLLLTWTQRNVDGFWNPANHAVSALELFGGQLYAGTTNDNGAEVWSTSNGSDWTRVFIAGFTTFGNGVLFDMIVFNNQLYIGTGAWPVHGYAGQIWRTPNGTNWERVTGAWESNANNAGVNNFAIFNGALYITTYNPNDGAEVYRSSTGNPNDWTPGPKGSFGLGNAYPIATGLADFNGSLYIALTSQKGGPGARILRTADGTTWAPANTPGFGNPANYSTGGFAVHRGYLYAGTGREQWDAYDSAHPVAGQIWRSPDGTTWAPVETPGFGDPNNRKIEGFVSALGTLFAFTDNDTTGTEVWSSVYGTAWEHSNQPGFGSANNKAVALWSNGTGILANQLFLGTFNQAVGGQVWAATPPVIAPLLPRLYLPFIAKG